MSEASAGPPKKPAAPAVAGSNLARRMIANLRHPIRDGREAPQLPAAGTRPELLGTTFN
jgi:hypothetical protein